VASYFSIPVEIGSAIPSVAEQITGPSSLGLPGLAGERHFTPKEIAKLWGLSETKIRRLFEFEPGVLRLGEPSRRVGRKLKRSYYTMRIPETVALRVHRRLTSAGRQA